MTAVDAVFVDVILGFFVNYPFNYLLGRIADDDYFFIYGFFISVLGIPDLLDINAGFTYVDELLFKASLV